MHLAFGKTPPGRDYPALFAIGKRDDLRAIWRSDDVGATWVRVNDAQHEYGRRFRCIAGDPRVFGRVYVGTDGRGIVYGEPSSAGNPLNAVDK
jgi:xyloglucan-specific exo-beta-1,4-glucanase